MERKISNILMGICIATSISACNSGLSNNSSTTSKVNTLVEEKESNVEEHNSNIAFYAEKYSKFCILNSTSEPFYISKITVDDPSVWANSPEKAIMDPWNGKNNSYFEPYQTKCVDLKMNGLWSDFFNDTEPYSFKVDIKNGHDDVMSFMVHQSDSNKNYDNLTYPLIYNHSNYYVHQKAGSDKEFLATNVFIVNEPLKEEQEYLSNYMTRVPDDTELQNMLLIGAHDAGVNIEDGTTCLASKQKWAAAHFLSMSRNNTKSNQLKEGVRYFDIRLEKSGNQYYPYHRSAGLGCRSDTTFNDSFENMLKFLDEHPSEFIVLRISHISSSDVPQIVKLFNTYMDDPHYADKFLKLDSDPNWKHIQVGELRGKVVLLMGCEFVDYLDPKKGYFSLALHPDDKSVCDKGHDRVFLGDYSSTQDFNEMNKDQLQKLRKNIKKPEQLTVLSFNLTYGQIVAHTPRVSAYLGIYAGYFGRYTDFPWPHIIYYDFVNAGVNNILIHHYLRQHFGT